MKIGYARVSTGNQELALQLSALKEAGCEKIFTEVASGAPQDRLGLNDCLDYGRPGDSLVVWKLDRLGRSMKGLVDLAEILAQKQIDLISLTDGIDTKTPAGRFFFNIMAAMATMERELILERTRAGLDAAKLQGKIGGRKRVLTGQKLLAAKSLLEKMDHKQVAKSLNVSLATLYRYFPASDLPE